MASPFDAAMRSADLAIDRAFAEMVRVEPQKIGEYVATGDPDRSPYSARMIVGLSSQAVKFATMGRMDGELPQVASDEVHIWALDSELPDDLALWPRASDRLVLLDRPREHGLIIAAVEPDGLGRSLYRCTRTPLS